MISVFNTTFQEKFHQWLRIRQEKKLGLNEEIRKRSCQFGCQSFIVVYSPQWFQVGTSWRTAPNQWGYPWQFKVPLLFLHPSSAPTNPGRNTGALPQILVMLAFEPSRKEKTIVENNKRTGYAVNTQAPWLLQNQPLSLHNPTGLHDHSQQICRKSFKRHIGIRSRTAKQLTWPQKIEFTQTEYSKKANAWTKYIFAREDGHLQSIGIMLMWGGCVCMFVCCCFPPTHTSKEKTTPPPKNTTATNQPTKPPKLPKPYRRVLMELLSGI